MTKCSSCNSEKIITDVQVSDIGMNNNDSKMQVILDMAPDSFWSTDKRRFPVSSTICCDCGKIEFKIEDTERLWNDYQEFKKLDIKK